MRAARKRQAPAPTGPSFETLEKGTPLEGLTAPALTQVALARFAGATDDYNPLHLDERAAAAVGKPTVFAPCNLLAAHLGRVAEGWLQGGRLVRFGVRMTRLVWPGDVLTCRGQVVDKRLEDGQCIVDADVWADNQRGETVAKGRVLAVVPAEPGGDLPPGPGWTYR
jgi:acyl dehydratase